MEEWMPSVRSSAPRSGARRALPRPLRALVVGAALASAAASAAVLPGAAAAADEPAGTALSGRLVQAWAEAHPDAAAGSAPDGPVAWVEPDEGAAVRIDSAAVADVPTGATVELTVSAADGDGTDAGTADAPLEVLEKQVVTLPTAAPAPADPAGLTNRVTVVLVRPGGVPADRVTEAQVVDAVNGPVADFWSEQSGGSVRLGVVASRGWTTTTAGCADAGALWDEVADAVDFVPGDGNHLLLYLSGAARGCSYALAEVGGATTSGGRLYVQTTLPSALAHEFGHNFGLGHSSAEQCDGAVEDTACRTVAYRDLYDVMGGSWGRLGSLTAPQADRINLLPAAQTRSLTVHDAPGTTTLAPLSGRTGTRAVRLTDAEGVDYWLEYRTASGRDEWLGTGEDARRLDAGVLLRRAGAMPDTSVLLDGTPGPAAGWDADYQAALPVGVAVPVSGGDFSILVQGVTAAGAVLTVTPTPPAAGAAAAAEPAPAGTGTGTVMSADGALPNDAVAPAAAGTPELDGRSLRTAPALRPAADSSTGSPFLVAAAGALVAASALLVVLRVRRPGPISR